MSKADIELRKVCHYLAVWKEKEGKYRSLVQHHLKKLIEELEVMERRMNKEEHEGSRMKSLWIRCLRP